MPRFDGILGLVAFLILVFLVMSDSEAFQRIFQSLAGFTNSTIGNLQGRRVSGSGAGGVTVGGSTLRNSLV